MDPATVTATLGGLAGIITAVGLLLRQARATDRDLAREVRALRALVRAQARVSEMLHGLVHRLRADLAAAGVEPTPGTKSLGDEVARLDGLVDDATLRVSGQEPEVSP